MRALVSIHMFASPSHHTYAHNAYSRVFTHPSNRDLFKMQFDQSGPRQMALPAFLASNGWKNATTYTPSAHTLGHNTDMGIWEWVKSTPERQALFSSAMRSMASVGDKSSGPYDFDQLKGDGEMGENDVLMVDIGGGRGQVLEAVKEHYPQLKGRMILQDQEDVIRDAKKQGLPEFIEPMAASFFEPQTVKGKLPLNFPYILSSLLS